MCILKQAGTLKAYQFIQVNVCIEIWGRISCIAFLKVPTHELKLHLNIVERSNRNCGSALCLTD